jgi:carbon-monoxide dehydrogenase large subunit
MLENRGLSRLLETALGSEKNGQLRGRSVTCYIETAGYANERMEIRFDPDGTVTIVAGTHSHGQGHATTYAQMVAEWLGVSFETIRFIQTIRCHSAAALTRRAVP